MKDLEKIKSEDLAAQVQDANPANFAIEQEVAQLVGATVPQPTQPSADDARELGAQLLVFLRRALLPIRSALRTAVAAIYAHLDSRCTDYTPAAYAPFTPTHHAYDPMGSTPRTLPNLLTALTAFSARKISNGSAPNDGIPDGTSLARLLGSVDRDAVTELKDDTVGWIYSKDLFSIFPNVTKAYLGCTDLVVTLLNNRPLVTSLETPYLKLLNGNNRSITLVNNSLLTDDVEIVGVEEIRNIGSAYSVILMNSNSVVKNLTIKDLKKAYKDGGFQYQVYGQIATGCSALISLYLPSVETWDSGPLVGSTSNIEEIVIPKLKSLRLRGWGGLCSTYLGSYPNVRRVVFGPLEYYDSAALDFGTSNLIDLEFGQGTCCNLNLSNWNPTDKGTTFLQNFKEHIALRLTSNGSGKTLTLSQAVRNAIHAAESTYGIENIIVTQKGWTISPAPGASSQ